MTGLLNPNSFQKMYRAAIAVALFLNSTYLSAQAPVITSVSPSAGNAGSTVQLTGNNFSSVPANNAVYFGAVKADVVSAATSSLTVSAPASATYEPLTVTANGLTGYAQKPFNLLFGNGIPAFTPLSFGPMAGFGVNGDPLGICVADFNMDGKPDMVTLVGNSTTLAVFRNTSTVGTVSFAAYQTVGGTGRYATMLMVADMDGDGKKDIIVANGSDNSITVLRNISQGGNIQFSPPSNFSAAARCHHIAIGDLNNDGRPDIASTTNAGNGHVTLLKNNSSPGSVAFATPVIVSFNQFLGKLLIRDLDNDGSAEIAVLKSGLQDSISILRNTTNGAAFSFAPVIGFATSVTQTTDYSDIIVAGDMDGDDKYDLLVADRNNDSISVMRNTGTPGTISFAPRIGYATGSRPTDLSLSDLDGDGKPDILVACNTEEVYHVFKNNSTPGSFTLATRTDYTINPFAFSTGIAGADMDGDSKPDVAVANSYNNQMLLFKNLIPDLSILSFSPDTGLQGTMVTIKGRELNTVSAVRFGNVPASSFSIINDTTIQAVVGAGNSGQVTLISSAGSSVSMGGFVFTGPYIQSFAPQSGSAGTLVSIRGINFNSVSSVYFGTVPAASFTFVSDTLIRAVVGYGQSGAVIVNAPPGTASKDGFNYIPVPAIIAFTPSGSGIASLVTITGRHFTGATAVKLGPVAATSFTVVSDSVITATTAASATGSVSVTTSFGTAVLGGFIYLPVPSITSFTPLSAAAGTSISITGTGFNSTAALNTVWFGGAKGIVTTATANFITVTVPAGAKNAPITVTADGLTGYSQRQFTLNAGDGPLTTKSFVQAAHIRPAAKLDNLILLDFDGDGKPDVASAGDSLVIQRNTSSVSAVSFAPAIVVGGVGHYTVKMATGDLNGDGKPDLATVTRPAFNMSFLTVYVNTSNPGTISFAITQIPCGSAVGNMIVTDLDKDGRPDIVLNGNGPSGYPTWIYRNTSTGGNIRFAAPIERFYNVSDYNICAADLDGDTKTDLVTTSGPGGNLLLIRNTSTPGTISFAPLVTISVGGYPTYCHTADMDGDGKQDIIVKNGNFLQFSIFKNASTSGSFSFSPQLNFSAASYHCRLFIADLDGGGKPDIAVLNVGSNNTVSILRNTSSPGTISLAAEVDATSEYNMEDIDICDLDGDGKPDMGLVNQTFIVMRNVVTEPVILSVTPSKATAGTTVIIKGYSFTAAGLVTFSNVPATSFTVLSDTVIAAVLPIALAGNVSVTNAAGTGTLNGIYPVPQIASFAPANASPGDTLVINGSNFSSTTSTIVYMGAVKAPVLFATDTLLKVSVPPGALCQRISVTANGLTAYSKDIFNVVFEAGDTSFTSASFDTAVFFSTASNAQSVAIHDLDADGRPDLAVANVQFATILKNTSTNGRLSFAFKRDSTSSARSALGDMDGDGLFDKIVTFAGPPFSITEVYKNVSDSNTISFKRKVSVAGMAPFTQYASAYLPAIDDMNRDGKPDIIMGANNASGTNGSILVMLNKSTDSIVSLIRKPGYVIGTQAGHVRTGDLDGDSIPDVISIHNVSGGFAVLRNTSLGDAISFAAAQEFATPAKPGYFEISDMDGDGKKDIIVAHSNNNSLSVFRNSSVPGNISFAPGVTFATGNNSAGFSITVGDLNGDGKPDIVATNSADSTVSVYKNNSVPGNIMLSQRVNYKVGSFPNHVAIGDVNLDGYPDIAVVNSSSSTVAILQNSQGVPIQKILCSPVDNATLYAGTQATSYQWQISTDSIHFSNITDNANYAGANTNVLVLSNIPSAWYGFQYRCVADGGAGRIHSITFQNTWTGVVNNDWFSTGNWSCGTLPDGNTDVYINGGAVILNADASVRTLTVKASALLTITSGVTLTITH